MQTEINEFSEVEISQDQLVPWPRVAAVGAMVAFSLPTFITGLEIYHASTAKNTLLALILGSALIFMIGAVMGVIGAKTRMSSYLLVRLAFGDKGASVVNVAFAISLLGWFGVNINLFADALANIVNDVFQIQLSELSLAIVGSFCMTLTTIIGFSAINRLASLLVPVLFVVTILLASTALKDNSIIELWTVNKVATMSLGEGISAVVGAIIVGAIILPDITRFVKHWSGAIYTALIAYIVVQLLVMAAASMAGAATGKVDILEIMLDMGLGIGASIIVITGSWVLNSLNLYSAVLSSKATFPKLNSKLVTIVLGLVGIVVALMNILDSFITFIFYLSIIFIPVAGIIISDFLLIHPKKYAFSKLANNSDFNHKALVAWVIGAVFTILATEAYVPSISGIAAIDAMLLSALIYCVFAWRDR